MARQFTLFAAILLACVLVSGASAQTTRPENIPQGPAAQRASELMDRIRQTMAELNLSDDQKQQIELILSQAKTDFNNILGQFRQADPQSRRQKFRDLTSSVQDKIKAVLTPDQKQKFDSKMQDAAPTTQTNADGPPRVGAALERLRDSIEKLDLTNDQKQKIQSLFSDTRQKVQQLRQQAQGDAAVMREKIQPLIQDMRQQLSTILTPEQLEQMRDLVSQSDGPKLRSQQPMQDQNDHPAPATQPQAKVEPQIPPQPQGVQEGQPAPDFTLKKLDGNNVQLSTYKNKILLLIFGSYSSPSFRQRATQIQQLERDYGFRLNILIVYTRESNPISDGEVERNKEDGISIEQPKDLAGRTELAKQARAALKLNLPVAIDSMDDKTATDYGGFTNAAVLIGRDGTVLARQKWFDAYGLKPAVDDALKTK